MARIDDYINARKIAVDTLSAQSFDQIVKRSGFSAINGNTFRTPFLDRVYTVDFPDFGFKDQSQEQKEVPLQEQILILHYMIGGTGTLTGNWISYREIPGASFYFSAFVKRAIDPLKKVFGRNTPGLKKAAKRISGKTIEVGDAGFEFMVFPQVPVQLVLWEGDDEFPPEANILFDETIGDIFSPEDVAWLAGMVVYRLIALSH